MHLLFTGTVEQRTSDDTTIYLQTVCAMPTHHFVYILYNDWSATFWDGDRGGAYDLKIWIQPRFLYNAPIHQVSSSYV